MGTNHARLSLLFTIFNVSFFFAQLPEYPVPVSGNQQNYKPVVSKTEPALIKNVPPVVPSNMRFTPNKGQLVDMAGSLRPDILYKADCGGSDVYLRKTGISYVLSNSSEVIHIIEKQAEEYGMAENSTVSDKMQELIRKATYKTHRIDVDFMNCKPEAEIQTYGEAEGYFNFFYSHCPEGITHVNSFEQVTIKNIYNNIDVKYYGGNERACLPDRQGLKYDIVINPGGNPNDIKLKYSGAEDIEIKNGELRIKNSVGEIVEKLPKVYQNINGKIVDVNTEYRLQRLSNNEVVVHFSFLNYNSSFSLVIDPWASYYGGSGEDVGMSVATDPSGNPIFTGYTGSVNFPVSPGPFQAKLASTLDAFVVKMNANGGLIWATYIGGSGLEHGNGITTDASGNIFVTGDTGSPDFPTGFSTGNIIHQSAMASGVATTDAFLIKLNSSGGRLWSTFYGGSDNESGYDVASDGANVYLCGKTISKNGISTSGAFQPSINGTDQDVFIVKIAANGSRVWGTYVGGSKTEYVGYGFNGGITYDPVTSCIYITGQTLSTNFPVTPPCHQSVSAGGDNFLCRFNATGALVWSTYYVGGFPGADVTTDTKGNVIVFGTTQSLTGIATPGAYQPAFGGGPYDTFIAKFNSNGLRLWGTYLGGNCGSNGYDLAASLVTDANDNIYVYGEWEDQISMCYPASACAYQPNLITGSNPCCISETQFIAKYDPNGMQRCFTNIGGGNNESELDNGGGITIFGNNLYITGASAGGGYPVTPGAFQTVFGNGPLAITGRDAFFTQLCINICETKTIGLNYTADKTSVCINAPVVFTPVVSNTCDTTGYKFKWIFQGGNPGASTDIQPTVTYSAPGSYAVKLVLSTLCKKDSIINMSYITVNNCGCTISATAAVVANVNCSGTNTGSTNVSISNGSGPFTYSWSNGVSGTTTSSSITLTGLSAKTYTVTITDGICASVTSVTITQPLNINSVSGNNVTCNAVNNGSATVNIGSSTSGPYTYNWSNGVSSITTALTSQISNLASGTYTVTITTNSCSSTSTVTITEPVPMVTGMSSQWSCLTNNGSATAYPANGTSPYNYLWSNLQTTATVAGLSQATYTVTVTDVKGCTATNVISVANTPITLTPSSTNISCTTNGSASVTVNGGAPPYLFNWSNGQTGYSLTNGVVAGNYTVTVTGAGGCTATQTFNITGTSPSSATFTQSPNSTVCVGATVNFTNTGTTGTYTWTVGFPINVSGTTTDYSYTFLSGGSYTITHYVTTGGCTATATSKVTVIDCSGPVVSATGSSVCTGGCASVSSTGSGGAGPYTYLWSTGATTQNINPCPALTTTYTVTIKDTGGNTSTSTAVVTINPSINVMVTSTNITCNGGTNGSAIAAAVSGISPYTYNWSNLVSGSQVSGLSSGTYSVTITDSKGCTGISTTTITSPPPLFGKFTKGIASCVTCGCKQWIMINATGGTSPYSYSWPDGYDKRYKNQLCPGAYTIKVTDKNNCSTNITLTAP